MLTHPLYRGKPWFMPALGSYYQIRDVIDKRRQHACEVRHARGATGRDQG
jgi:hypothetical protein